MEMKTANGKVAKVWSQTSAEAILNRTKVPPSNLPPVKVQPRSGTLSTRSKTLSTRSKVCYTAAIYFAYFSYGVADIVVPTAMDDIVKMVRSDVATFSKSAMVSHTVVYCFAAVIGGSLSYLINRQLYLTISLLVSAGAKIWLPFTSTLLQATICQALSGLGGAGIDVATNAWLLAIWREGSGSLMQTMHFCFAVGTSLSPLLTEPFLSSSRVAVNETTTLLTIGNQTIDNQTTGNQTIGNQTTENQTVIQSESQIHIPLFICGALYLVSTLSFSLLHFVSPYDEKNERMKEKEEKELNTSSFSPRLSRLVLAIASLILMFDVGSEVSTFDYNTVFVIRNGFNAHKAAFVSSVKSISFTLSRAVAAVVAVKVPIRIVLYFSICINAIGNGIILYSTKLPVQSLDTSTDEEMVTKETMIWLGFAFIGFGFGPLYPAVLSFVENYIKLTTFICGVFVFVGAWSTILNFLVVGKFIEEYVNVLTYFNLISITGVAISFILLDVIVRKMTMFKYSFGNKI